MGKQSAQVDIEMTTAAKRQPMKYGLDYVRGKDWRPILFSLKGAKQYMERAAKRSPLRSVPRCVALVSDCGDYWRGNVAAYPFRK